MRPSASILLSIHMYQAWPVVILSSSSHVNKTYLHSGHYAHNLSPTHIDYPQACAFPVLDRACI